MLVVFLFGCNQSTPVSVENSNEENENITTSRGIHYFGVVQENREFTFMLYPGVTGAVNFQPWKLGRWKCYAWHTNAMAYNKSAGTSYYWRDANNPGDPYHWWANDATGYNFALRSEQVFNSGSAGITYEIRFRQWSDYGMPIHVLIVPD